MPTPFDFLNAVAALERPEGVIAFPTDTVYGMGCLPTNPSAIQKIYRLRQTGDDEPLILIGHSVQCFDPFLGEMTFPQAKRFRELANAHWPGGLVIEVPKSSKVPGGMTRGQDTVRLRVPDYPFLGVLLQMIPDGVLVTDNAALPLQPGYQRATGVYEAFGSSLDFILMNDESLAGSPVTIVAVEKDGGITILSQGSIVLD
jgi:L-threonylcarbamoyladenylate synthase